MSLLLTSIQRFSTNDGPGIRTTLFTKGCSIRCPWCANPENLSGQIEYFANEHCYKEGTFCSVNSKCSALCGKAITEKDYQNCGVKGIGVYGKLWSVSEVLELCLRDKDYWGNDGGVTASGGEALLQGEQLKEVFIGIRDMGGTTCVETSLYVNKKNVEVILPYLDYLYIDMKLLEAHQVSEILHGNLDVYLDNLEYVFTHFDREKVCIRIPLVKDITCTKENLERIAELLYKYKPGRCEIFSVHNLGQAKYKTLQMPYEKYEIIEEEMLMQIKKYLEGTKVMTFINKL